MQFQAYIHTSHNPKIKALTVFLSHLKAQKVKEERNQEEANQQQPQPPPPPPEEEEPYEEINNCYHNQNYKGNSRGHRSYKGQQGSERPFRGSQQRKRGQQSNYKGQYQSNC